MGNTNGREEEEEEEEIQDVDDGTVVVVNGQLDIPMEPPFPNLFSPQVPVAPLPGGDSNPVFPHMWTTESQGVDLPPEKGIPTMITWTYGGNNLAVEGSWDNWKSRKLLQRSGKDHSVLLVLPSGIYRYKFIVDGEPRYIPDLPFIADETGHICNLLDVHDYVPENLDSVAEFEAPPSPESSYDQAFLSEEDLSKEPVIIPPQLQLTVLGTEDSNVDSPKPRHVVLNHLFIEKGWASQSIVSLGLTHRFESKYVTVVLYKSLKRGVLTVLLGTFQCTMYLCRLPSELKSEQPHSTVLPSEFLSSTVPIVLRCDNGPCSPALALPSLMLCADITEASQVTLLVAEN